MHWRMTHSLYMRILLLVCGVFILLISLNSCIQKNNPDVVFDMVRDCMYVNGAKGNLDKADYPRVEYVDDGARIICDIYMDGQLVIPALGCTQLMSVDPFNLTASFIIQIREGWKDDLTILRHEYTHVLLFYEIGRIDGLHESMWWDGICIEDKWYEENS